MKPKAPSFNKLEFCILSLVPTLALAAYLATKGVSLSEARALLAAVGLGFFSAIVQFALVKLADAVGLRDEVLLVTALRLSVGIGLAVYLGSLVVG